MLDSDAVVALAMFPALAAVSWAAAFAWAQWLKHRHDTPTSPGGKLSPADAARLERLETGLDALSIEVERLAETQRFTARLLEERLPRTLSAAERPKPLDSGRVITPH